MATETTTIDPAAIRVKETVREKYGDIARDVLRGDDSAAAPLATDPITSDLYTRDEAAVIPLAALQASLGCGNPTALAELKPGETVLDLGSGGGIDVLLSARRVGPGGFAYGLDMTDEMLALAEQNRQQAGARNVAFLKGEIEAIPLPEAAVDVIISNCVINLSADKGQVLREAFRVLRPGGRFAVSDVVAQGVLPDDLRADMEAWVGCVAGALEEQEYRKLLADAGFDDVEIEVTRVYDPRELAESVGGGCCGSSASSCCGSAEAIAWDESAYARFAESGGRVVSAFVRARKP
jgi:SAM-dependent methyltransferase